VAIYQGVLEQISGGSVVSSEPAVVWTSEGLGGTTRVHQGVRDAHRGWVNRQFVDIGGKRLVNVMFTQLCDELAQEAIGQEVTLAVWTPSNSDRHRKTVLGIRTPRMGTVKPGLPMLLMGAVWGTIKVWIAVIAVLVLTFIPAGIAAAIFGWVIGLPILIAGWGFGFWLGFASLRGYTRMVKTWRSLPAGGPAPAAAGQVEPV